MTHFKVSDEAFLVAETAYERERLAGATHEQAWHVGIEAALPVLFDQVYQQEVDGYWSDQPEAVKNWWDGRKTAPQFRIVYRIKEPK